MSSENGDVPACLIRPVAQGDADAIWAILEPVIRSGETMALPRDMDQISAMAYWTGGGRQAFVAIIEGIVVGTSYLRANQAGGGAHVANGGYATAAGFAGRGIARQLCAHGLQTARAQGFRAMQFNFVVSTNTRAVRLWQTFGFRTVGVLPSAFDHPQFGPCDALVMYLPL